MMSMHNSPNIANSCTPVSTSNIILVQRSQRVNKEKIVIYWIEHSKKCYTAT